MAKQTRFKTLEYNGPLFPEEYKPQGFSLGNEKLTALAEEMLWNAARYIENEEYWTKLVKTGNFYSCLKPELTKGQKTIAFPKEEYMVLLKKMKAAQDLTKEQKKQLTKEDKQAIKLGKEKQKEQYGSCIMDGKTIPLGNYIIEPPGIIMTRGKDPRFGNWKYRVQPEDVTLNVKTAPKGWKGKIKWDPTTIFAASYSVRCGIEGTKTFKKLAKHIYFSSVTSIRQNNTEGKYDKSASILKNWKKIQKHVYDGCLNGNENALVAYLIQQTGIRIGNERDPNKQALTYGASTLLAEHVECFIEED